MTACSQQRILRVISQFRPAFRSVAQCLTEANLIMIEHLVEALLLDYDRLFAAVDTPACIWRRTGEICKANQAFAQLVRLTPAQLSSGQIAIYELFDESSAVNYFE
ncbi:hypothetical protein CAUPRSCDRAFT_9314, partial [Caulochytrium protostelioides]